MIGPMMNTRATSRTVRVAVSSPPRIPANPSVSAGSCTANPSRSARPLSPAVTRSISCGASLVNVSTCSATMGTTSTMAVAKMAAPIR